MRTPPVSVACCEIPFPFEFLVKKPVPCTLTSPCFHAGSSCAKAAELNSKSAERTVRTATLCLAIFFSPFVLSSRISLRQILCSLTLIGCLPDHLHGVRDTEKNQHRQDCDQDVCDHRVLPSGRPKVRVQAPDASSFHV